MKFRTMCAAVVTGAATLTSQAQAADPMEACNKAFGKVNNSYYKELGKGIAQVCAGKTIGEVAAKAAIKINKAVAKANKVHEQYDCNLSGDPNAVGIWPFEEITAAEMEDEIDDVSVYCNGELDVL